MRHVASLWIGNYLGVIELICINSFLKNGGKFVLYTYGDVENVPDGVDLRDANDIMDGAKIVRHLETGSPAIHADLFRLKMLEKTDYIWVDLDILALKPFDFKSEWVFAYESDKFVNGAVLRLPKYSFTLKEMLKINVDTKGIPPHLKYFSFDNFKFVLKALLKRSFHISNWPWGSTCPLGLTFFFKKTGEIKYVMPVKSFYPIPFGDVEKLLIPGAIDLKDFGEETFAVHLWGKEIRGLLKDKYKGQVPVGSFLYRFI